MNIFRLVADMSHLVAIVALIANILRTRSCAGLSGKTQLLFLSVFVTRYLDLFTNFISAYNTVMKVLFILLTLLTVLLIYLIYKKTYDRKNDSFRAEILVFAAMGLALAVNHEFSALEVVWTFSIYLEAVAILPQLFMISKTGQAETITVYYLIPMAIYRALYIANWVWRYYYEGFYDLIAIVSGCVQTLLYIDFFYLYCTKSPLVVAEEELQLVDI